MEDRGNYMDRRRELKENFEPVVSSNQKLAEDITTNELKEIRQNIALKSEKRIKNEVHGTLAEEFLQKYMDPRKGTDTTFGIRYESGIPMIGNKEIKIDGNDIIVDGSRYHGISGLWSLATDKDHDGYGESDYHWYTDLLHQTDALYQGFDRHTRYPRASRSNSMIVVLMTNIMTQHQVKSEKTEQRHYFYLYIEFLYIIVNIFLRIVIKIERINEK